MKDCVLMDKFIIVDGNDFWFYNSMLVEGGIFIVRG